MTSPRQQINLDRQIEHTLANGAQVQCQVEVMWMGRLEESHIPWMEEQLLAKVREAMDAVDPDELAKGPRPLARVLSERCEAAGEEHGIRGQVGEASVRGFEVTAAPGGGAAKGQRLETRQGLRLMDPFQGMLFATAQVIAASEKDAGWAGAVLKRAVENEVLEFIDEADDLEAHLEAIGRAAGKKIEPKVAELDIVIVSVQLDYRKASTGPIPIANAGSASPGGAGQPQAGHPGQSPAPLPDLTLEQYASLCVDRQIYPGQEAAIAPRYHVASPEALQQLDQQWQGRLAQDPALHQRFQQACNHYRAWLQQQRGG